MAYVTTAPTFASDEVVTAAKMNALADGIQAAGTAYTPIWTAATVNPAIGNGTLTGAYHRVGKWVLGWRVILTIGSTTTFGTGQWFLTAPLAPIAGYPLTSVIYILDTGTANRAGIHVITAGSAVGQLFVPGLAAGGADRAVDSITPQTWATGDQLVISGSSYELP